ncbi:DUF4129 domain-containing protein [Streptomyces sp. NBC_00669]|uniref:DUF4129 domain-containing protein n=1 Tax=unclassified Streptomyces TaxID=2593676 RepID=UPI002E322FCB|nr:DUF4129 domain-containing protein [Streptomyces sp. NBC_00669]
MALAVIVVAGIGVAALLLRPDSLTDSRGRGPLGGNAAAFGVAVLWLVAAIAANRRYRERFSPYDEHRTATQQRLADVVRHTLMIAPAAVPVLLLALHDFRTGPGLDYRPGRPRSFQTVPPRTVKPSHVSSDKGSLHIPGWLLHLAVGLLIAVAVAAVAYAVRYLLRMLRRVEHTAPSGVFSVVADDEELLAQAVRSGRRALLDNDDARAAVIACYVAMETSLAASGVARRASDSPQDLLERAAAGGLPAGPAAGELTELFREARYSTHPMDDGHRRRASDALSEIAAQLERRADGTDGTEGSAEAAGAGAAS